VNRAPVSSPAELHEVVLDVNGVTRSARVPARRLLSDMLRHDLQLTGTHVGCEHGVCGACTVLLEGEPIRSCLTFAVMVDGARITTVEGLAGPDGELGPVQRAFRECHGLQCGFCTPGFLLLTTELLARSSGPGDDEITEALGGNLCRCTGYVNIVRSVRRAAELASEPEARP
jgi:carbon-monoxide dehydrogenase small subunit